MENNSNMLTVFLAIAVILFVIIYVLSPVDLMPGPVDDALLIVGGGSMIAGSNG